MARYFTGCDLFFSGRLNKNILRIEKFLAGILFKACLQKRQFQNPVFDPHNPPEQCSPMRIFGFDFIHQNFHR
jgi:hypothetical protein